MIVESVAILLVGVILIIAFVRSKHLGYAAGVLPIAIIPVFYLLGRFMLYISKGRFFGVRPAIVMAFIMLLAIVISCAIIALFSLRFQSKRNRTLYLVVMLVYTILLGWVYLYTTLYPLIQLVL